MARLHGRGWLAAELRDEFPHLGLRYAVVEASPGRSPRVVKERLRVMSDRITGGKAIRVRREHVPWAYRVFFRQIGIDPDERRTPIEAITLERMRHGGLRSMGLPWDALVIATLETGVSLMAFDADRLEGEAGLRLSHQGERLGESGRPLSFSQIVVSDSAGPVAVLFGDVADDRSVSSATRRILLCAVQVKGVPDVSVDEALWTAVETIAGPEIPPSGSR